MFSTIFFRERAFQQTALFDFLLFQISECSFQLENVLGVVFELNFRRRQRFSLEDERCFRPMEVSSVTHLLCSSSLFVRLVGIGFFLLALPLAKNVPFQRIAHLPGQPRPFNVRHRHVESTGESEKYE